MQISLFQKYHVIGFLHENERCIVYRANRITDNLAVIIKMLKASETGHEASAQLIHEYQVLSGLNGCCIPKIVEVVTLPSQYFLVFEDIGAVSLHDTLLKSTFTLRESLTIAIDIAKTLQYLHQMHIIHADVNPKNIVYNSATQEVLLIDYGYSVIDNHFRLNKGTYIGTSGNLLYMSPEQTGRTRQRIDFRSDLYSFGMTLYHLFSGKAPYEESNRYELIHKQVALMPESLRNVNHEIPEVISRIVDKLIAKHPNLRYQSDESLIYDLEECLRLLKDNGDIENFKIASHDGAGIRIGARLYGRSTQLKILEEVLDRMINDGPVSLLVSGSSGVGKTRLLEEFFTYAQSKTLSIVRTKFEFHKTALPYAIFKQIFVQLRTWILTRGMHEQKLNLSPASTQILSYIFAELRTLLKSNHPYGVKPIENMSHKLPFALQEFFSLVATKDSPIIFFMDDLQWADTESLNLIKKGILNINNPYLHFVGSYRNEENEADRIRDVFYDKNRLIEITVEPLLQEDITEILEEILGENGEKVHELGMLLHTKTQGNPFYFKTMVEELIARQSFVFEKGCWQYSLETIKAHSASSNIATIINAKYEKLSVQQQTYLCYLTLFGSRYAKEFTVNMMRSLGQKKEVMDELAADGFLELTKNEYLFVHDQIQDHVDRSINAATKQKLHLKIGTFLENAYKNGDYKEIDTAVYHLNHGYDKGKFPKKLFSLNIAALQNMVNNGAYVLALQRVRWIDENLFNETLWRSQRSHTYAYSQLRCRVLYLNAAHDEALKSVEFLITIASNIDEHLECFRMIKNICVTQGKNFKALITYGNKILKELGMDIPTEGSQLEHTLAKLDQTLLSHPFFEDTKKILSLPIVHHKKYKHIAGVLIDYWEAAYYLADMALMKWSYMSIVVQSFTHGNTTESSFGYVLLGGALVNEKKYKKGYAFGDTALKLNRQLNDEIMLPKVHNFMANFINPYLKPLQTNVTLYQKSLHQSKINGDIVFGTWANFLMLFSDYLSGNSLEGFRQNVALNNDFILSSGDSKMIAIFTILTQTAESLQESTNDHHKQEAMAVALWEEDEFYPALAWYAVLKAQTSLLKGEFDEGLNYFTQYVHTTANEVIMFPKMRLHFVRALLLMGKNTRLSPDEQNLLNDDLEECESLIQGSKTNFKFVGLLLKAEQLKGVSNIWDVARAYDEAIQTAQKINNPFFLALAGLCASRFWSTMFFSDLSRFYLNEAIVGLNSWGAYEITAYLKKSMPKSQDSAKSDTLSNSTSQHTSRMAEPANFESILDSFYAISRALNPNELVNILMQTILKNATASRAVLILKEEDEYYIKATIDLAQGNIEMSSILVAEYPLIPQMVIQYALNSKENLLLETPIQSDVFNADTYIQTFKPSSCSVITSSAEGAIRAVLYLENESVSTPLSEESVRTLELLLTQASIVLKNTLLYETLTKSSEELNKAQELSHLGSWLYHSATGKIEWSAEVYRIYDMVPFSQTIDYEWFIAHVHRDDVELVENGVQKALNSNPNYSIVYRIITAKGNEKVIHQNSQTYWEDDVQKTSGTIQDITEAHLAQAQISRLHQVVDQNPFSTIITDHEGVIQYVNKQAITMTGYFEQELIGKKMNIFCSGIHPKEFYSNLWETISHKKQIWRGTIINTIKNGQNLDCASTIFPIFSKNQEISNFVTIQENVTQQNIKDKLFMMQTRQAQMGEMLSMIAHQWRQPLSVISALMNKQRVNIALEQYTPEGIEQSLNEVDTQVQYLSRTISDFRDFFKPDKEKTWTKNSTILQKTLALIGHTLKNEKIEVVTAYSNDASYLTYEHEMVQVILNLIKNSQDAFSERNITNPKITILCDHQDQMSLITVDDNAQGIDLNVINTLFLPYVSTKDKQNGTGLGLYMSKTIVEEHCQGTLRVENTASGAKFTITIPIKDSNGTL